MMRETVIDGVRLRILSDFPNYAVGDDGSFWSKSQWRGKTRWRRRSLHGKGRYRYVTLCVQMTDLVLTAFAGARPEGYEPCHLNGDSTDNRAENLVWLSKSLPGEMWRPCPSFPRVEASSFGRIRGVSGKVMLGRLQEGYHWVAVGRRGKRTGFWQPAHRVVCDAFIGPLPRGYQVNHKNGIRQDNRPDNLEYVTPSENSRHAYKVLGRKAPMQGRKGAKHNKSQRVDAIRILQLRSTGMTYDQIAVLNKISSRTVWRICNGTHWQLRREGT